MDALTLDRDDPAGRAHLAVQKLQRRQRTSRIAGALALFALAAAGPLLAAPTATVAAFVASLVFVGCGVAVWPWTWSDAEREHHTAAAIWAQARPTATGEEPWTRYAAWARADDDQVELVLITRAGTADGNAAPSPFAMSVKRRLDPDAVGDAAVAMEALRDEAAEFEGGAHEAYLEAVAAAARKPLDDALREVEKAADEHRRHAEAEMRRELAEQDAAERRAQAAAVARALRRP
jgi:hypothetical protein